MKVSVTARTSKALDESIDVVRKNEMIVESKQFNSVYECFNASSEKDVE